MSTENIDLQGQVQILFNYFFDNESGGFYTSFRQKRDDSIEPSPFSTIEALYSLMHSPIKSEFKQQISLSLNFLIDKLEQWDGEARPYPGAEDISCEYSTLSISFSLIVLARGRKFIQNHDLSPKLEKRITAMVDKQLNMLLEAKRKGGWSYVPANIETDGGLDFEPNVYCTAIALQALINCNSDDFQKEGDNISTESGMIIVDGFNALINLAEIPNVDIDFERESSFSEINDGVWEEAVLMSHWMHVLSHVLYDTERWVETVTHPTDLDKVNDLLKESSELLSALILNTEEKFDDLKHGFADISYELSLEYPRRTQHGKIKKDEFQFELPGSTALPALVLNPNIPIWSEANTQINTDVINQFNSRKDDLQRVHVGEGDDWFLHQFSAPLVGVTYMQSVHQGIMSLMQHFLREGEVINLNQRSPDDNQDSKSNYNMQKATPSVQDSKLVNFAVRIDRVLSEVKTSSRQMVNRLRCHSGMVLIPSTVIFTFGYVYSAAMLWPDAYIFTLAISSGLFMSLTTYEYIEKWVENRVLSMLSSTLPLIVIVSSSIFPTSINSDLAIFAGFVISAIAVFANILVNQL